MKYIFLLILSTISTYTLSQELNPKYDSVLAERLGADDYGMKSYVLVILKTGSNKSKDKNYQDSCFRGHMANIDRLAKENIIIIAGPLEKNDKTYRGIFIMNVNDLKEAKNILKTDPAIHAKFLEPNIYKWYGSAALPEYLEASDKVWKYGF